jgi:thiol:disulfide interchange protein DsbA
VEGADYNPSLSPLKYIKDAEEPLELINLFWYGCGTCRQIDPIVDQYKRGLKSDVVFKKIHTMYAPNPLWMIHAQLFHTLDYMGKEAELHKDIFVEVQENGGTDGEGHQLAGLTDLISAADFAARKGIPREDFIAAWNSPEVKARMDHALTFIDNLNLDSVPAFVVNGKWSFPIIRGKGLGHFFQTAEKLMADERELLAKSGQTPKTGDPSLDASVLQAEEAEDNSEFPSTEVLIHQTDDKLAEGTIDPVTQDPVSDPK